ncbi:MAG: citryl-CoA lyase [Candidatus Hodarchaeales archaeon]
MGKQWETKITKVSPNELLVRGYPLDELIGSISYAESVFLLLKGRLPNNSESHMFEAILVSSIDHGVTAPSAVTARTVASCGVPITTAMSAGIMAVGNYHGGAGEQCMEFLKEALNIRKEKQPLEELATEVVRKAKENKKRIPGYGHRFHTHDPRTKRLLEIAGKEGINGDHIQLAQLISDELTRQSGRELPLNVDGAIGAILADMGFEPSIAKAIFAISRIAGLTAHVIEEFSNRPVRTIIPGDAIYTGPEKRSIS